MKKLQESTTTIDEFKIGDLVICDNMFFNKRLGYITKVAEFDLWPYLVFVRGVAAIFNHSEITRIYYNNR